MMVSKSAFWFSNSCLPAPLPLWATSCQGSWEQAADWNVIRQSEFVFQLCTLVSIPTLRVFSYSPPCSSHSSSHGIVYSALPGVIRQSRFYIVCTWSVRSSDVIMVLMYPASYKHSRPGALFKSTLFSTKKHFGDSGWQCRLTVELINWVSLFSFKENCKFPNLKRGMGGGEFAWGWNFKKHM